MANTQLTQSKDEFVEQVKSSMSEMKVQLAELQKKASQAAGDAKTELQQEVDKLSDDLSEMRGRLDEIRNSSGDAWHDMANAFSDSWERFKLGVKQAYSRYA